VNLPNIHGERMTKVVHGNLEGALGVEQQMRRRRDSVRDAVMLSGLRRSSLAPDFIEHLLPFLLSRSSPLCFILFDGSGAIREVSDGACGLLGRSREDLLQARIQNVCPPVAALLGSESAPNERDSCPKMTLPFHGARGDMELEAFLMRVSAKGARHFALMLIDTRAHTHRSVTSAIEDIFNYAPVGIYQITPEGRIQYANACMAKLFGYDSAETLMVDIRDLPRQIYFDPDQRREILALLDGAEVVRDVEFQLIRRDRSPFWARFTSRVVRDESGKVLYYEGFISDISARRKAERELQTSLATQEKYRRELETVFQAISDGILSIDKAMRVMAVNPSFERICPQADRIRLRLTLRDLPKGCVTGCFLSVGRILEGQPVASPHQVDCPHSQEKRLVLEVATSPLTDRLGACCGAVLTLRDISKILALGEKLTITKSYGGIVGKSPELQKVYFMIERLRETDSSVLITGESGTGKELLAEALHYSSRRKTKPFVKINCAALSETLLESDLFGHVKGSFTGADSNKAGRLQIAEGGTVLLDEIGDISHSVQVKLLRFLDHKEYQRVGDPKTYTADVRIITSTNADLVKKIEEGVFRSDLYYRLKIITINTPPLRAIKQDLPMLVQHFLNVLNKEHGKNIANISKLALEKLMDYHWPGNVRELKHVLEYACVICREQTITTRHLPPELLG
jgi:PAS domain S-box-containing protein